MAATKKQLLKGYKEKNDFLVGQVSDLIALLKVKSKEIEKLKRQLYDVLKLE